MALWLNPLRSSFAALRFTMGLYAGVLLIRTLEKLADALNGIAQDGELLRSRVLNALLNIGRD